MEKNNDALHDSLEQLILESSDPFLKSLFPKPNPSANSKPGGKVKKLAFDSVGKKFRVRMGQYFSWNLERAMVCNCSIVDKFLGNLKNILECSELDFEHESAKES